MLDVKFQSQVGKEIRNRIAGQFPIGVNNPYLLALGSTKHRPSNYFYQLIKVIGSWGHLQGSCPQVAMVTSLTLPCQPKALYPLFPGYECNK